MSPHVYKRYSYSISNIYQCRSAIKKVLQKIEDRESELETYSGDGENIRIG